MMAGSALSGTKRLKLRLALGEMRGCTARASLRRSVKPINGILLGKYFSGYQTSLGEVVHNGFSGPVAKIVHAELPYDKERLERFFASAFVKVFNEQRLLGDQISISNLRQNNTHDLDFAISCPVAYYLELAELNPQSEFFGRTAYRTGGLNVYDFARWIWFRLIEKKGAQLR